MYAKSTRPSAKREVQKERSAQRDDRALRSAKRDDQIARSNLRAKRAARDENVPAKRADFFFFNFTAEWKYSPHCVFIHSHHICWTVLESRTSSVSKLQRILTVFEYVKCKNGSFSISSVWSLPLKYFFWKLYIWKEFRNRVGLLSIHFEYEDDRGQ